MQWLVVAAEPMTDIDTTGAEMLQSLIEDMAERRVVLAFAELKGPPKDRLRDYGLLDRIGEGRFYETLGTAVHSYVDETGVDWKDWTDDEQPNDDGAVDER